MGVKEGIAMRLYSERIVFTVEETGSILGLSRGSAYDAVRRGDIPAIKIGRRLLVPRVALEKMLTKVGLDSGESS